PLRSSNATPLAIPAVAIEALADPQIAPSLLSATISTDKSDHPLLQEIYRCICSLPLTVPLGAPSEPLAQFAHPPTAFVEEGQDPWEEVINPALDRVLGFGKNSDDIRALIRRGDYGMDGLYRYLKACISDLNIYAGLFEGKIRRLIDAMVELTPLHEPQMHEPRMHEPLKRPNMPNEVIYVDSRAPSPSPQNLPTPVPDASELSVVKCPGYLLALPDGASPFASYPFLLHTRYTLPWNVMVDSERLILYSKRCTETARVSSKGKEKTPLACHYCARLHDNDIVMGIRHRILDGTHENATWVYLTPSEMYALLQRKTNIIHHLKLRALNNAASIRIRNRQIQTWKRLVMAIGKSDIPRLRALMATQVRSGASVYSILEKVDKAACRQYSPKGYEQADFERAFLIYKLGGRSAANIAHRALGVPSIDATKRHIATAPLQPSPSFPTRQELSSNLQQCYPPDNVSRNQPKFGMSIQFDELKVQERLRWDPRTNNILGVCREHGKVCALQFCSINQAESIALALREKRIHLATEVTVIGSSILCNEPRKYVTKPFGMSGSCKQESVADQEKLIRTSMTALKEQESEINALLYCLCSDGDARRRRALINIAMKADLDPDDPSMRNYRSFHCSILSVEMMA
ncbi:hypothetical protein BJ912DRAFT_476922, partial [Pholiota molesta]